MNEKLHKLYIAAIFEAEKQDLTEEGLGEVASRIEYPETKVLEILRLMDFDATHVKYKTVQFPKGKPGKGIFTIVDDTCKNLKAEVKWEEVKHQTDEAHAKSAKDVYMKKNARENHCFKIIHSAQPVIYDIKEFRDRNIDNIPLGLEKTMCEQTAELVSNIYQGKVVDPNAEEQEEVKKKPAEKTIWKKFNF